MKQEQGSSKSAGGIIELMASDGHLLSAYLAETVGIPRGGIVVVQDAYGLGDYVKSVCDSYAREGYFTIAPAIYDRQERNAIFDHSDVSKRRARLLRSNLSWDNLMLDLEAARRHVSIFGNVGIIGFCVGGSAAWLSACHLEFSCASAYYGKDISSWLDMSPKCPILLHFGDRDHLISIEDISGIQRKRPDLSVHLYPAGHGFDAKDPSSAFLARHRTLEMFRDLIG